METPGAGRVHLVLLRLLNLVPRIRLLQHVAVGASYDVRAVEQRCIETGATAELIIVGGGCCHHANRVLWRR